MVERNSLNGSEEGGVYFRGRPAPPLFSSGCGVLDCVLGGGWAEGRIANIIGDSSTGKTLLAIEACANFLREERGRVFYAEAEAAFDPGYAAKLGLSVEDVEFPELFTVEEWFENLYNVQEELDKNDEQGLYILDSLDALSDKAEMERDLDEGSYGTSKAKQLSEMFRRLVRDLSENMTILIISQVRDNIGVTFGRQWKRSGGRALDFYASQILVLSRKKKIKRQRQKVQREVGILVRAYCDKNKIAAPYRECDFPLLFGYGVDDLKAGIEWLSDVKRLDAMGFDAGKREDRKKQAKNWYKEKWRAGADEFHDAREELDEVIFEVWDEVESRFDPEQRKY